MTLQDGLVAYKTYAELKGKAQRPFAGLPQVLATLPTSLAPTNRIYQLSLPMISEDLS